MNGLASITPKGFQTPPQNQGLGQLMGGPKPTAREQMAIEVVNDDIEPLDLDPKLEAALKLGEAKELLQSANQVLAPNPANIVQQLQQEVPAGIAALTARMQGAPQGLPRPMPRQTPPPRPMPPGIMGMAQQMAAANQQGRQAPMPQRPPMPMQNAPQRAPAPRPPMAGGLPQLPSNLPRAAQGGIVAFKDGGFPDLSGDGKVTRKDILMGRGVVSKAEGGPLSEADSYMSAQAVLNNPNSTDQEKAFARATLDSLRPIQEGGNMTMDQYAAMMQEVSRRQQGGMAGGGVVGFQSRGLVEEEEEEEEFTDFTEYPPPGLIPDEVEEVSEEVIKRRPRVEMPDRPEKTEFEEIIESIATEQMQGSEEEMMREVGESFDKATGLEDYRTAQREAEQARQALRQQRFSPEEERRRLLREGLLGTAEQGLGGFARGMRDAENRIYGEKLEAAQEDVATMDKITDTFQQLGMSRFEAQRNAQKLVRDGINSGLSAAASLANAQRQAETTYNQMVTQAATSQRGQDIQVDVAEIYARRGSETNERSFVNDYVAAALAKDPNANEAQLRVDAAREYKQMTALISATGRADSEVIKLYNDAREMFDSNVALSGGMGSFKNTVLGREYFDPSTSPERQEAIKFEFIKNYIQGAQGFLSDTGTSEGGGDRNQPIILPDNFKDYGSLIPNQQYLVRDANGDMVLVRWDSINRTFNEI